MNTLKRNLFIFLRRTIYTMISALPFLDKNNIAVFCYHAIGDDNWQYSISANEFKKQINYLLQTRKPVTTEDVVNHIKGFKKIERKSFLITFDDGYKDILLVEKFLFSKNIKPAVFVLSDPDKANHDELENTRRFLSKRDILYLKRRGWTIGNHSATHSNFAILSKNNLYQEIYESKHILEKKINNVVEYFAYPKGNYNEEVLKTVKRSGYKMAFSVDGDVINQKTNIYTVPRIGVDRTHTIIEFPAIYSILVVYIRKMIGFVIKHI